MKTYKKAVYVAALGIQVHLLTSTLMISQSGFNALTSSLIIKEEVNAYHQLLMVIKKFRMII